MGLEIERKFLVSSDNWKSQAVTSELLIQGYLSFDKDRTVRVRIVRDKAYMTIKSNIHGIIRQEIEFPFPHEDASTILAICKGFLIYKTRNYCEHQGLTWEVDVFHGENEGLVVAEVEIEHQSQDIAVPEWAGREVSYDPRYLNSSLANHPYRHWSSFELKNLPIRIPSLFKRLANW